VALDLTPLLPDPWLLAIAVALDLALGDPSYAAHPVRLIGRALSALERTLRAIGLDGYGGGIALFATLGGLCLAVAAALLLAAAAVHAWAARAVHLFLLYSLLALGDLLRHGWLVEAALRRHDLAAARHGVSQLVGRDTAAMDAGACRRAVIESLAENLTDGFVSPVFWYVVAGVPGLVLFKVVSTMDSMVGYRTERYLRFGWCGARLDDVMNYVPARLTWLLVTLAAAVLPACSARRAFRVGLRQHGVLPSPNSGWPEAATAGGMQRRLVGPIWRGGQLVTDIWIGDPGDPPAQSHDDFRRAARLVIGAGLLAAALAAAAIVAGSS
jgi:adenosylcobinamide-phosphate synthase